MEVLFLLLPLSLIAVVVAVVIFVRMNMGGQFDETEAAAFSVLMDDDTPAPPSATSFDRGQNPRK